MKLGAHIKSTGGCQNVFERAAAIGAEAIQIFLSAPQQWRAPVISDEQLESFRRQLAETPLPVFFHGVYLVNLGTEDEALLRRSVTSLTSYLEWGAKLGAQGTIFHVGSHKGAGFEAVTGQVCRLMREVLDAAPNDQLLIMENNAGQGGGIGSRFAELGAIIRGLDNDRRVRVCLDTCHAFAMGYDIASPAGCEATMAEFDREIGLDRLVAVHANDSKMPLGGVRDRHENIGDGHIGTDGFRTVLSHPAFADVPFFLEVPGLDGKGPDKENVDRLKRIRAEAAAAASARKK
jgi:apurinic endonuclease APN1